MSTKQSQQKLTSSSPPPQKPTTASYTHQDTNDYEYQQYIENCEKYWRQQETNELVTVNWKSFTYELPPPRQYLTTKQGENLKNLRYKHRIKLLENKLETNFRLRFNGINMNSTQTQKQLKQYKLDICNYEECPCCRYNDYLPKTTIIVPTETTPSPRQSMQIHSAKNE